jgi:hypothetical protein
LRRGGGGDVIVVEIRERRKEKAMKGRVKEIKSVLPFI